jgi:hypothetical protein
MWLCSSLSLPVAVPTVRLLIARPLSKNTSVEVFLFLLLEEMCTQIAWLSTPEDSLCLTQWASSMEVLLYFLKVLAPPLFRMIVNHF